MKKRIVIICMVFTMLFMGCNYKDNISKNEASSPNDASQVKEETNDNKKEKHSYMTWAAYWDMDNVQHELDEAGEKISSISYFEVYFNKDNQLKIPDGFLEQCSKLRGLPKERWITIVNDIVYGDGRKNSLKNTDLLESLFASDSEMQKHIDDIIKTAKDAGVSGVEIDYENIRDNINLWNKFIRFEEQLYNKLNENNLKLRIILETQTPFSSIKLPEGPEYVVMCYNLHGAVNDIGAKADKKFLKKTVSDAKAIKGKVTYALATGGFDWSDSGKTVKSVTEIEADELINKYGINNVIRDEESGAAHFEYVDKNGKNHEVWYGDGKTISLWEQWLNEEGQNNIAVWRLGGNDTDSINKW